MLGGTLDSTYERIQALQEELHLLSSYRNTLTRVNQLPPEVLLTIFHLALTTDLETQAFVTLTRITSVCAHWRNLSIEHPTLWTHIDSKNLSAIDCMIGRSRLLPLSMKITFDGADVCNLELSDAAARLENLEISVEYSGDIEETLSRIEAIDELPLLENLSLECRSDRPEHEFTCNAPMLSTLFLHNIALRSQPGGYSRTLRHFIVHYQGSSMQANLSLTAWLDLLSALPNLETLDLEYPVYQGDETLESEERTVSLTSLKRLKFRESVGDGVGFLPHLTVPADAKVDITFHTAEDVSELETQVVTISSVLEPLIKPRNSLAPLRALTMSSPAWYDGPCLTFSFASTHDPLSMWKTSFSLKLVYDGYSDDYPSIYPKLVIGMKSATTIVHLNELAIDGASESTLPALQNYEWADTLVLRGALWPRCLRVLLGQEGEERVKALSNIHTLVLCGVPFHWIERHELLALLEGSNIRAVRIEMSTGVSQDDIIAIREKVEVTWDEEGADIANYLSALSIS